MNAGNTLRLPVVAVVGPTASGKSALALELALAFNGEIVNCDSLQVYRGLDIGTAKTPAAERRGVPHHMLDLLPPTAIFSAGDYAQMARPVISEVCQRGRLPVLAGGTGFYLRSLLEGLDEIPSRDEALRARIERRTPAQLHRLLKRLDQEAAARIHPNDGQKLVRALEIRLLARRPAAELFTPEKHPARYEALKLVLDPPRTALHARIEERTRQMFAHGLVEEVRELVRTGVPLDAKPFEAIGYRQAVEVLAGHISLEQAITSTVIATRQYAKRQLTWFRRETGAVWIQAFGDSPAARDAAMESTNRHLGKFTQIN